MEEGILTGESKVSGKHPDVLTKNIDLTDKANMMFSGTLVAKGKGVGVVVATGMSTEMGIIQENLTEAAKDSEDTPLKKKIKEFGD